MDQAYYGFTERVTQVLAHKRSFRVFHTVGRLTSENI